MPPPSWMFVEVRDVTTMSQQRHLLQLVGVSTGVFITNTFGRSNLSSSPRSFQVDSAASGNTSPNLKFNTPGYDIASYDQFLPLHSNLYVDASEYE